MARIESNDLTPTMRGVVDYNQFRFGARPIEAFEGGAREFESIAEYEKFMQDLLVIEIHKPDNPQAPWMVYLGSNGETCWLPRGAKLRIPRRFVENLARSQRTAYSTRQVRDPQADDQMVTESVTSPCYPFAVLQDPQPIKGRQWLERVTRQGC